MIHRLDEQLGGAIWFRKITYFASLPVVASIDFTMSSLTIFSPPPYARLRSSSSMSSANQRLSFAGNFFSVAADAGLEKIKNKRCYWGLKKNMVFHQISNAYLVFAFLLAVEVGAEGFRFLPVTWSDFCNVCQSQRMRIGSIGAWKQEQRNVLLKLASSNLRKEPSEIWLLKCSCGRQLTWYFSSVGQPLFFFFSYWKFSEVTIFSEKAEHLFPWQRGSCSEHKK